MKTDDVKRLIEQRQALNVDAVNMKTDRVDETAKGGHEPVAWEWVGLTDEDIAELRRNGAHSVSDKDFMAIEARLKEKNV